MQQVSRFKNKKKLSNGLVEEDLNNIAFVKKWDETRQTGIYKYCIVDGGIIAGACLSVIVSLVVFFYPGTDFLSLFPGPLDMFVFIAFTYITGGLICVGAFRAMWHFKERKFIRLTDPFDPLFMSPKTTLEELL